MNIFSLDKEVLNDVIKSMGCKEIAICSEVNHKDYLSCTCGFSGNIDRKRASFSNYSSVAFEKFQNKVAEHLGVEKGSIVYSDYKQCLICPLCGNPIVFDYVDTASDYIPMRYEHKVIQDDEKYLVIMLSQRCLKIRSSKAYVEYEDIGDTVLLYDKVNKKFYVVELYDGLSDDEINGNEPVFTTISINPDGSVVDDGLTVGSMCSNLMLGGIRNDMCYMENAAMVKASGLNEIVSLINNAAGTEVEVDKTMTFDDVVQSLFKAVNYGFTDKKGEFNGNYFVEDKRVTPPNWFLGSSNEYRGVACHYLDLINAGVDVSSETVENAFGISAAYLYKTIDSFAMYEECINTVREMKSMNLSEQTWRLLESTVSIRHWNDILNLSKWYQKSVESVVKCIVYAKGLNVARSIEVLKEIYGLHGRDFINIDVPLSYSSQIKSDFISKSKISAADFDSLIAKPTLDNLCKIIEK